MNIHKNTPHATQQPQNAINERKGSDSPKREGKWDRIPLRVDRSCSAPLCTVHRWAPGTQIRARVSWSGIKELDPDPECIWDYQGYEFAFGGIACF